MRLNRRTSIRRLVRVVAAAIVTASMGVPLGAGVAAGATNTYENPVSKSFADTFADPAVMRAKDGYWYACGTSDPLREGQADFRHRAMPRSGDVVHQ